MTLFERSLSCQQRRDAVGQGELCTQVSDVDRLPRAGSAGGCGSRIGTGHSRAPQLRRVCVRHGTMERNRPDGVSFTEPKCAVAGLAEPRRVREDGLEHGLEVAWRTADDAKDLGGRRLPLQRLIQLAGILAQLAGEQLDFLFVTGLGSWRSRVAARRLYRSASLRLPGGWFDQLSPNPPNGLDAGEMLSHRWVPSHPRRGVSSRPLPSLRANRRRISRSSSSMAS